MKAFILSFVVFISAGFAQTNNIISLTAYKDSAVTADEMVVQITVNKTDTSSTQANELTHNSLVNVLNVLEKYGYKKDNIFLISSNFQKQYLKQNEFYSIQTYRIILNKFDLFDQLKKDLLQAGATGVSIGAFWINDYENVKKILYHEALTDAKARAKYLCTLIGAKSFTVENLMDNSRDESINGNLSFMNNYAGVMVGNSMLASQSQLSAYQSTITNGRINIVVSLRITFKFKY
ncbi:MAG: SIMPL domain-containing protein [Ignavibacteriaceae bacterium]